MVWNTSDIIVGALLFVIGYALGRVSKTLETARISRARWVPDPHVDEAHIEAAVRAGNKIDAMRLYRQRTGTGVKEAKQAVEALAQRINARFDAMACEKPPGFAGRQTGKPHHQHAEQKAGKQQQQGTHRMPQGRHNNPH